MTGFDRNIPIHAVARVRRSSCTSFVNDTGRFLPFVTLSCAPISNSITQSDLLIEGESTRTARWRKATSRADMTERKTANEHRKMQPCRQGLAGTWKWVDPPAVASGRWCRVLRGVREGVLYPLRHDELFPLPRAVLQRKAHPCQATRIQQHR